MTASRKHIATTWHGSDRRSTLVCKCGDWRSDRTQPLKVQQAAHRLHRREHGETVTEPKPSPTERLRLIKQRHLPDEVTTSTGQCGCCLEPWPCTTWRLADGQRVVEVPVGVFDSEDNISTDLRLPST